MTIGVPVFLSSWAGLPWMEPLDASAPKFFGFSEFLAALALIVLAWTIGDLRYRLRIRTAPLPLQGITFFMVSAIGVSTLLTDLWRAEQWSVPSGTVLTPALWQAIMGGTFLLTFLTWVWFAFIHPPRYGRLNSKRFAMVLYREIIRSSPSELPIIADELCRSIERIIRFATDERERARPSLKEKYVKKNYSKTESYANDILLLISDKRFCRAIVESSQVTALILFQEINLKKKYGVRVAVFAKNILNEAILNRNSFLYHESEGYESGLLGYLKPLSKAMYSNYTLIDNVDGILDPDIFAIGKWDASQWRAYCRIVLISFEDYVEKYMANHSHALYRAFGYIKDAPNSLYKIEGSPDYDSCRDQIEILQVVVDFIKKTIDILDKKGLPTGVHKKPINRRSRETLYDYIAEMIYDLILYSAHVTKPVYISWTVQHNLLWGEVFSFDNLNTKTGELIKYKIRRLIFNEIVEMTKFPNFKGAHYLAFCLNIMGIKENKNHWARDSKALHKMVLCWYKNHYAILHQTNPRLAESCLMSEFSYDHKHYKIIKTNPNLLADKSERYTYFKVNPPNSSS